MPAREFIANPRAKKASAVVVTRQTPWEQLPDALTLREAAAKLGVSERRAYELAGVGQFPGARKIGNSAIWIVSKWDLMAYLNAPTQETKQPAEAPAVTGQTLWLKSTA